MKRLYLMRHGHAPSPSEAGVATEALRPLSEKGRSDARRIAAELVKRGARPALILHSPLARAVQTAQAAACNGLHTVDARLARWLLLAQDRVDGTTLPMTHRFLGLMLGVRRASVTSAASGFQKAGLIRSLYGRVDIVDRAALEAASCECYSRMRGATEQVFAGMQ